jgi:hypothetical protein
MKYTNNESRLIDLTDNEANQVQGGLDVDLKGFTEERFTDSRKRLELLNNKLGDRLNQLPEATTNIHSFFDRC